MTPPDSPSPRTEAGKPFTFERWLAAVHEDHNGLIWTTKDELRAVFEHEFHAEAAQEAPAPEGLRAAIEAAFPAFDYQGERHAAKCNRIVFSGSTGPDPEPPDPCSCGGPDLLAILDADDEAASAPPSPAEPPRSEFPHMAECRLLAGKGSHSFCVCGCHRVLVPTTGTRWASAATNYAPVRAEARPPEGLAEPGVKWLRGYVTEPRPDARATAHVYFLDQPPMSPEHTGWTGSGETEAEALGNLGLALAARLSARGAEPR